MKTKEIEEAFYKHQNSSFAQYLRDNFENIGIKWDKSSFTAGANWMQEKNAKEIEQLKQRLEELQRIHSFTLDEMEKLMQERKRRIELGKEVESLKQRLSVAEMAIKKANDDHWFMINLIERYSSDKEQALKDVLERLKFRKPLYEKTLAKISAEKEQ